MFRQYTVDLIYRSWVHITSELIANDNCGHYMMCDLACLDAKLVDSEHQIFPAIYNHDTEDIIDYINAFSNGFNNVSETDSCSSGCQNIYKCDAIQATISQFLHNLREFAWKQFQTRFIKMCRILFDFYKEDMPVILNFLNRTLEAVNDDWDKIKMNVFHNQTLVCDGIFLSLT